MSKTRRRYVVELTKGEFEALFSMAICGQVTMEQDGYGEQLRFARKCYHSFTQMNKAKANGLKTLK
jgi:hypothetical protein